MEISEFTRCSERLLFSIIVCPTPTKQQKQKLGMSNKTKNRCKQFFYDMTTETTNENPAYMWCFAGVALISFDKVLGLPILSDKMNVSRDNKRHVIVLSPNTVVWQTNAS